MVQRLWEVRQTTNGSTTGPNLQFRQVTATYIATSPLYVYSVNPGFQILSTTPLDSVNWSISDAKLSFQSDAANVKIYVPSALKISPDYVRSCDISLPYTYPSCTLLLSFSGSSNVVVHFVSGH